MIRSVPWTLTVLSSIGMLFFGFCFGSWAGSNSSCCGGLSSSTTNNGSGKLNGGGQPELVVSFMTLVKLLLVSSILTLISSATNDEIRLMSRDANHASNLRSQTLLRGFFRHWASSS
jgi:hypothetical protein